MAEIPTPSEEPGILLDLIAPEIRQRAIKATVNIYLQPSSRDIFMQQQSSATGIHIGEGRIITAAHTFRNFPQNDPSITVNHHTTQISRQAQVSYIDNTADFCVLEIPKATPFGVAEISTEPLTPQQTLLLTEFQHPFSGARAFRALYLMPLPEDSPERLRDSFIIDHGIDTEVHYPTVGHGSSGGGVFDTSGKLVGMMWAQLRTSDPKALALQGQAIQRLLQPR